uniref:Movement protein n=1 Tax=Pumpkin yellows virus TaxID=2973506 RepID=A0A976SRV2_9VIRU|nr:movement protein [Pumpkin yellows virus]UVD39188.1 movement protein [Pumpkin yellows virus]
MGHLLQTGRSATADEGNDELLGYGAGSHQAAIQSWSSLTFNPDVDEIDVLGEEEEVEFPEVQGHLKSSNLYFQTSRETHPGQSSSDHLCLRSQNLRQEYSSPTLAIRYHRSHSVFAPRRLLPMAAPSSISSIPRVQHQNSIQSSTDFRSQIAPLKTLRGGGLKSEETSGTPRAMSNSGSYTKAMASRKSQAPSPSGW